MLQKAVNRWWKHLGTLWILWQLPTRLSKIRYSISSFWICWKYVLLTLTQSLPVMACNEYINPGLPIFTSLSRDAMEDYILMLSVENLWTLGNGLPKELMMCMRWLGSSAAPTFFEGKDALWCFSCSVLLFTAEAMNNPIFLSIHVFLQTSKWSTEHHPYLCIRMWLS